MSDPNEQRRPSRTEKLPSRESEPTRRDRRSEPNPIADETAEWPQANIDWRARGAGRGTQKRKAAAGVPGSPQEIQIWLQNGGWKLVAGAAAFFIVLLIALLAMARNDQRTAGTFGEERAITAEPMLGAGSDPVLIDLTPTVIIQPTATPAAPQFFVVVNTGEQGLNLRADHTTDAAILTFYNDGEQLEQIGEDFIGSDRLWRQVRGPDGLEGWVAADFLQPAP
jgi:Bacterial SH3 domain